MYKYLRCPGADTAFLVVKNNVSNTGMAIEYIVQKYIGVYTFHMENSQRVLTIVLKPP